MEGRRTLGTYSENVIAIYFDSAQFGNNFMLNLFINKHFIQKYIVFLAINNIPEPLFLTSEVSNTKNF